jgi:hypothetical protein
MFTAILSGAQQALLERLSTVATVRTFYLAGGTALALHLGHRRSVDFDFFRPESFDPAELCLRALDELKAGRRVALPSAPMGRLEVRRVTSLSLTSRGSAW